jgi:uridine phosphorylase
MSIPQSDLIITPKGTIYHLDLLPEQLAPTVFTVGDPARVAQVSRHFDRIEWKASHREFITHTGYVGRKRVSVISSGIGPDNIDIVLNELDALVNIDFETRKIKEEKTSLEIIRLGTSGALQEDIPLDATFVSAQAIGLDNLLYFYKHDESAFEQEFLDDFRRYCGLHPKIRPYLADPDPTLLRKARMFAGGTTLTCPGFYGPQGRMLRAGLAQPNVISLFQSFRGPGWRLDNFEMETSALYMLGELLGHRCLSVSAIIANRATGEFSADPKQAVEQMIEKVLDILLED